MLKDGNGVKKFMPAALLTQIPSVSFIHDTNGTAPHDFLGAVESVESAKNRGLTATGASAIVYPYHK